MLQGVGGQPPPGLRRARRQVHEQHQGRERDGGEKKFAALSFFAAFSLARSLSRSLSLSLSHALLSKNVTSPSQPNSGSTLRKSRERKMEGKKTSFFAAAGVEKEKKRTSSFRKNKTVINLLFSFLVHTNREGGRKTRRKRTRTRRGTEQASGGAGKQKNSEKALALLLLLLFLSSFCCSPLFLPFSSLHPGDSSTLTLLPYR